MNESIIIGIIIGFILGESIYWLIIRPVLNRSWGLKVMKSNGKKMVVAVFKDRVMIRRFKVRHPFVTMNGRMYKLRDEDSIEVYMDDSLKPS